MKKRYSIIGLIVAMVLFWCGTAMALNPEKCDDWNIPDQVCIGEVEWQDMGEFSGPDGSWVWNQAFVNEFNARSAIPIDQPQYEPFKLGVTVDGTRMDFKQFANRPPHVRVAIVLNDGGISVPGIMRVEGPNGEQTGYFYGDYEPPDGCDGSNPTPPEQCIEMYPQYAEEVEVPGQSPGTICDTHTGAPCCDSGCFEWVEEPNGDWDHIDGTYENPWQYDPNGGFGFICLDQCPTVTELWWNPENPDMNADENVDPCCKLWTRLDRNIRDAGTITWDRFGTMLWVEKGEIAPLDFTDISTTYNVDYNNDRKVQNWEFNPDSRFDYTDHYFKFPDGIVPTETGINTFVLTYDESEIIELKYNAVNVDEMPVVPASTEDTQIVKKIRIIKTCVGEDDDDDDEMTCTKTRKVIESEQVVLVDNITAREINGALVIQWAVPDLALFPDPFADRIELRMLVGRAYPDASIPVPAGFVSESLWVSSPYQIGSIVVPADALAFIRNEVKTKHPEDTQLEIRFQYRLIYKGDSWQYRNRGYSDKVFIPIN